ncbi:TMAO reductase system periplasmic protein TorT [Vibrio fluvialis]|nr:TMAO reductase system periplasmic protein TorT [Vibrio fluvialis]
MNNLMLYPFFSRLFHTLLILACSAFSGIAAAQPKVCALYPHLKDSYWLSINYGMVDEASREHIELKVLEAGGYPNQLKQQQQIKDCIEWGAQAILLGTVSPNLYQHDLSRLTGEVPVFATVNHLILDDTQRSHLKGEVGVDWYWMGYYAGDYLAKLHPQGSGITHIGLLPGPELRGGTKPMVQGFYDAIQRSDIRIDITLWADNDKELQRNLVQQVIEQPGIDYIVGSAVAIEAAISELRNANKQQQIQLVSTYLSHGVYRGLLRDRVAFAPSDRMVEQGRLSVRQAAHYLRGESYQHHAAPEIAKLTPETLSEQIIAESLSPSEFRPTFEVKVVE